MSFKSRSYSHSRYSILEASCSECPNPDNAFNAIKSVREFAQARREAVESVSFPKVPQESRVYPSEEELKNLLIEGIELGVRSYNVLKRAGVNTVFDVVKMTEDELRGIPNIGDKSADEVIEVLKILGLALQPTAEVEQDPARQIRNKVNAILENVTVEGTLTKIAEERKAQAEQTTEAGASERTSVETQESETDRIAKESVLNTMGELPFHERRIIELRFGLDGQKKRSRRVIGEEFQLSVERIRQLEGQALRKLRVLLPNELGAYFSNKSA